MTKPWKPGEELLRIRRAETRPRWPEGATAGLLFLGVACAGTVILLYKLAGPKDIFGS